MPITAVILLSLCSMSETQRENSAKVGGQMFKHFQDYQQLTEKWFQSGSKEDLTQAFSGAEKFVPFLVQQASAGAGFPPGLDPLELANNILTFHQTAQHIKLVVPLLEAALDHHVVDGRKLREWCDEDSPSLRSTCQDLYQLLCWSLLATGGAADADRCVAQYNAPRPTARHFASPQLVHRQLPAIRAEPWWDRGRASNAVLDRLEKHIPAFTKEVLAVVQARGNSGVGCL